MGDSLQKRIHSHIKQVFEAGEGAWLVWCDPDGHWLPLLKRVAGDRRMDMFTLVEVEERTGDAIGGPVTRSDLLRRIDTGESFLLYAPVAKAELGWLWGQALLAEEIFDTSLRTQLMEWGWRPHSLTVSDDEVAALARANIQQDPEEWGSDGMQPDLDVLLDVLAGLRNPNEETRWTLDLTAEQTGLPPIDDEDLPGWRRSALARLLVTDAHRVAPSQVLETHARVIAMPERALALDLIDRWLDSHRLSQPLPKAIDAADAVAGLAGLLTSADVKDGPFVSLAAEKKCFANTCAQLAQLQGRSLLEALAALQADIERHQLGLWGHRMAGSRWTLPWGEMGRLCAAANELLVASPQESWATPQDAIEWYVNGGWRVDRAGEEIERNLESTASELAVLIGPLRRAYRARWEDLVIRWSTCWAQTSCPVPQSLQTAGGWLKDALASSTTPTAVLTVDALRYDLGASLAQRLNHQEGLERAQVRPARAPLPSITALGMGTALPIDEDQLEADLFGGKWQIHSTGSTDNLSVAQTRRDWWAGQSNTQVVDGLSSILSGDVPEATAGGQRLVVYDASIDRMGHDDELAFQGSQIVLDRYLDAIERLRDRGWLRVLLVTDHGFIHWSGTQEHHVAFPQSDPAYRSRRAAAYPATTTLEGPQSFAPGGTWKIGFPYGAACFQTYGGLGYFHGGASLQEWIIPCLTVEWPQTASPVEVEIEPLPRILSQRPKVILNVSTRSLLREDNIPRQVEILVRHAESQAILFRSDTVTVSGEEPQIEVTLQAAEDASADRNTPLKIQARDPRTEIPLAEVDSTLLIELGGW